MLADVGARITVRDDRGVRLPVVGRAESEWKIHLSTRRGGEVYREMVRTSWVNVGWLLVCTCLVVGIGLWLRRAFPGLRGSLFAVIACWSISVAVLRVTYVNAARKRAFQRRVRELVREGACPACEYPMRGRPVESDGCVVCSECGGAWRTS